MLRKSGAAWRSRNALRQLEEGAAAKKIYKVCLTLAPSLGTFERKGPPMSKITDLHDAVKRGDLAAMKALLEADRSVANACSETDVRGTYPLHVAAEFGQAGAARLLLDYGADITLLDSENDAIALCWAAFFGRPEVVEVLLAVGSEPNQRNKHGLTTAGVRIRRDTGTVETIFQCILARLAKMLGYDSFIRRCRVTKIN